MPKTMRKGYVLTLDAILALMFVIGLMLFTVGVGMKNSLENNERSDFKRLHFISEDAIEVLNKKGVLDEIGAEWANSDGLKNSTHWSNASNISRAYLSEIIPDRMGYRLMIGNETIYEHNISYPENKSSVMTRSARVLTGYAAGRPVTGYVSRAYLSSLNKENSTALLGWQRTVSSGTNGNMLNLTTKFNLPNDLKCNGIDVQALPRIIPNEKFKIAINGQQVQVGANTTFGQLSSNISCNYLMRGNNTMKFQVYDEENKYEIGKGSGTRMVVSYNTSEMGFDISNRFYLDEAESKCVFMQQSTLLMPGKINNISMHLVTQGVTNIQLAILFEGDIYPLITEATTGILDFDNAEIKAALNSPSGPSGLWYDDLEDSAYSFLFYFDTDRTEYDATSKTPTCGSGAPKYRMVSGDSYIEVGYTPFPNETSTYGYNMMSTPLTFTESGISCGFGYTKDIYTNFTIPFNAMPWSEDIWISWLYSGHDPNDLEENMIANGGSPPLFRQSPPDFYMVRYGYTAGKIADAIIIGNNSFVAEGDYDDSSPTETVNMLCFSKNLTSGTNNFLFRAFVDYGDVFKYGDCCNFNVTFDDNSYIGNICNSTQACGNDTEDSMTDALKRLVSQLDWDNDNKSDVKFTADQISMDSSMQSRVRSMWGPVVFKIVIWI